MPAPSAAWRRGCGPRCHASAWTCCGPGPPGARSPWTTGCPRPRPGTAPSRRRCSSTRWAGPCSWCWTCWPRPNGSRSCCMTCSACRSARSPRSSAATRRPPRSWPAGPGAGSAAGPRCRPPSRAGSGRWWRPSWPPLAGVTWTPCWPCWPRTWCGGPTRCCWLPAAPPSCAAPARGPGDGGVRRAVPRRGPGAGQRDRRRGGGPARPALLVIAMTVTGDRVAGDELIADPARLSQVELSVLD